MEYKGVKVNERKERKEFDWEEVESNGETDD